MNIFGVIFGGVTSLVDGWFKTKQQKQQSEAEYAVQKLKGSDNYDVNAQQNMKTSWKDEYLILVHTFLIWGYGIPSPELHTALDNVWAKMENAPSEWWLIYAGMVISTFGLRFMSQRILTSKGK